MQNSIQNIQDTIKPAVDIVSISTVVGTIAGFLPAIAALFTIVWTIIRICETRTFRRWLAAKQAVRVRDE
jgi:uncharacterized protein HemY